MEMIFFFFFMVKNLEISAVHYVKQCLNTVPSGCIVHKEYIIRTNASVYGLYYADT